MPPPITLLNREHATAARLGDELEILEAIAQHRIAVRLLKGLHEAEYLARIGGIGISCLPWRYPKRRARA